MSETDLELLARYTRQSAEDAFTEIVRRHVDLVHSAAFRQVRSPQLAEEVAQSTFLKLVRHARELAPDTILTAWLYQVTRREAIGVVRREARRQLREQIATEMNAMNATAADWTHIEPLLDEAMHALDETDRAAVLLRYFENRSLREVGQALGTSDDAAQKRVSRAVERLREYFAQRGVTIGASGLVVVISTNAVQAAPAGLATVISTAATALGSTLLLATSTTTATKTIAMTTMQKVLITTVLAVAIGTGIYEAREASNARAGIDDIRKQRLTLAQQMDQLTRERDEAVNRAAALRAENEGLNGRTAELLRLRGELTALRNQARPPAPAAAKETDDPTAAAAMAWVNRVKKLKQRFQEWPGKKTPELQLLAEQDWLSEVADHELDTDEACRQSMSRLRYAAKGHFAKAVNKALEEFAQANHEQLPAELSQLAPYLAPPADSFLDGYQITKPGWVQPPRPNSPNAERARVWAMVEKGNFTPEGKPIRDGSNLADADYDMYIVIYNGGHYGYGVGRPAK